MEIKIRKPGRLSNKPLSLDPYLEVLREKVTGDKKASVRKYCRQKLRRLTGENVRASPPKPQPC